MAWGLQHDHGEDEEVAEIWMVTIGVNGRSGYECCALGRGHCFGFFTGGCGAFFPAAHERSFDAVKYLGSRRVFMSWLGYDDLGLTQLTDEVVLGGVGIEVPKQGGGHE